MQVALSLRDRKAECFIGGRSRTVVDKASRVVRMLGCSVAERQDYIAASPSDRGDKQKNRYG
jgi:hypothetical protein